ncbi:MAG: bifunctional glutamate N-acetyltransferase/amino-acid acetyltransferase ArgJ [Actinobacteria bacterium]|nr:bifunctional glutamate N-acetyltransferase/amino-acid acetyltransferase ArgJ [Actinomycetota bacterium]
MTTLPAGFVAHTANIGIKDDSLDFVVVLGAAGTTGASMFTKSRFAGASVVLSRELGASGHTRGVVVVSKNSNVATGEQGMQNARELVAAVAARLGCDNNELVVASTGVIGRQYPMDRVRTGIAALPAQPSGTDASLVARAIMTTDTRPKLAEATVRGSSARVVGVAKGVGMIEPDMATHISLIFTDAAISRGELDTIFRQTVERTFNRVSIDTDTSTSDTTVCLASGAAGTVDSSAFAAALHDVLLSLTKQIARDGEGAERIIEVRVDQARDEEQAVTVARAIVNSPLVKTAVHGADPNWGRVAMAVGKCSQYDDIRAERVIIRFGAQEVFPSQVDASGLARLSNYMRSDEVLIHVSLGTGNAQATVWGCDLSVGYVRINADYTT